MHTMLSDAPPRDDEVRVAFARAARAALAGLVAAPAFLALASAAGHPLRAAVGPAFWICALAGFAGAGWLAGRRLTLGTRQTAMLALGFVAAGLGVAPAVLGLQGLTGHESMLAVAAATLPAFTAAFAVAGVLGGKALGIARLGRRGLLTCAGGGMLGGVFAMLPFGWAWLGVDVRGESLVVMGLAVVGFLGCLITPFQITGSALDRARSPEGLARD